MSCEYIKRTGMRCKNNTISGLKRCHLKTHHSDKNEYKVALEREIKLFEDKTEDPSDFDIYDVAPDGACLFRAIAQGISQNLKKLAGSHTLNKLLLYCDEVSSKVTPYSKKYSKDMLNADTETNVARYLQKIAVDWLCANADKEIVEGTGHTVKDSVLETHDLNSMEEYQDLYSIFAGDPDFVTIKTDKRYKTGVMAGQHVYKREYIGDRWGAYPEQYAISQILGVRIAVYVPRRYSSAQFKILKEPNLSKARLYTYAISEPVSPPNPKAATVNLILFERLKTSHYVIAFE